MLYQICSLVRSKVFSSKSQCIFLYSITIALVTAGLPSALVAADITTELPPGNYYEPVVVHGADVRFANSGGTANVYLQNYQERFIIAPYSTGTSSKYMSTVFTVGGTANGDMLNIYGNNPTLMMRGHDDYNASSIMNIDAGSKTADKAIVNLLTSSPA